VNGFIRAQQPAHRTGYLPMDCPRCGRRRLEYFINDDGALHRVKCEKCSWDSDDEDAPPAPAKKEGM
jgi:transposase-like protein